jgi:hypothetical protein
MKYEHSRVDNDQFFLCNKTKKKTTTVWTIHRRKGIFNACEHCAKVPSTIGGGLAKLNRDREFRERANPEVL